MAGSLVSAPKEIRGRWYLQVDKYHKTVKEICKIFGMSRKTYYKWYKYDHGLRKPNQYHSRKEHPQLKLTAKVKIIIYETKIKYNYGPLKMKIFLQDNYQISISTTTIYKYYKRKQLIRKPQKKLQWYHPLKEPYFATFPGENVQLDVKYVPGADHQWEYQYRFIDTVTNLQYAINFDSLDSKTTITALRQAQKYFHFQITGIQTDNGKEFRGYFHHHLITHKILHRHIPKRSAPWNGKVERANRSVDDEFYLNATKPWKTLLEYVNWYNNERPHLGKQMAGLTPYKKYLILQHKCVTLEG